MWKKNNKGFTIIELIVVIAIIAVLAGVVIVNVVSFINKGRNAATKANMRTILRSSAAFYDDHDGVYVGNIGGVGFYFCSDPAVEAAGDAISNTGGSFLCSAEPNGWCACADLVGGSNDTLCIDSTGYSEEAEHIICDVRCDDSGGRQCDISLP